MIKYSIIIPVKAINDYVRENVTYIKSLDNNQWELIILPNNLDGDEWFDDRIKIIASGRVGPATKRDIGANHACGEILVFLDDDSFPNSDLLSIASLYFSESRTIAIGGPAITPPNNSFWQKVSGAVFLSKYSGGNPERYVSLGRVREINDWPSVNFMVRRKDFLEIGGFNSLYWPGEDTKLCFDITTLTDKKILYVPDLVVWHHRRTGLVDHLKQVGAYGLHRGFFFKKYPKTSRKFKYLFPSILAMVFIASLFCPLMPKHLQYFLETFWFVYSLILLKCLYDINKYESITVGLVAISYIPLTHFYYGLQFIRGITKKKLISKLR